MEQLNHNGLHSLKQELRLLVAETGGVPTDFDEAAHFYLDLGIASVKALHLLMNLEERYGVQISDEQFVEATSLNGLTGLVHGLLQK